ncbi:DUF4212 domain-containing protein [Phytoactinopolyspora sp. XMNu-373]|uniref:DUF4212 domain-containing protein n=1 Tax=Phytoactinopolyspora mesophila TaxID=2650750 RepID=A0A7K3MC56_9ACTN|nr:DUF4212 domain-containing protein [Phytoactinopolyspora mesophila]NDL60894.1 DUF4212 domain-containing protein [Phytoactinopolyspora mesophila]
MSGERCGSVPSAGPARTVRKPKPAARPGGPCRAGGRGDSLCLPPPVGAPSALCQRSQQFSGLNEFRRLNEGSSDVTQTELAGKDGPPQAPDDWRRLYWRRNLRLMAILLFIWFAVSFGCGILFVEQLNEFTFFDYPLGFWFAQQGSIYTFVVLILVYALRMDRLDKEFGVDENGADDDGAVASAGVIHTDVDGDVEGGRQ